MKLCSSTTPQVEGAARHPSDWQCRSGGSHMHTQSYFSNAPRFAIILRALHQFQYHLQTTTKQVHYLDMGVPFAKEQGLNAAFSWPGEAKGVRAAHQSRQSLYVTTHPAEKEQGKQPGPPFLFQANPEIQHLKLQPHHLGERQRSSRRRGRMAEPPPGTPAALNCALHSSLTTRAQVLFSGCAENQLLHLTHTPGTASVSGKQTQGSLAAGSSQAAGGSRQAGAWPHTTIK